MSNIFNENKAPETQEQTNISNTAVANPSVNSSSFDDLLGMITNEQGERKYKDVPTALNGLQHSQQYISTLKSENAKLMQELENLRVEVGKVRELEETLRTLTSSTQVPKQETPQGLDEKSVADLVNRTLSQREIEAIQKSNLSQVVSAVQSKFGAEAENKFYGRARELGMSNEEINSLAARSPQAVLSLLGIAGVEQKTEMFTAPSKQSLNTESYQPATETFVKPNKGVLIGASTQQLIAESQNSRKLVDELHSKGLTTYDLTNPKEYFKYFGN